MSDLNQLPPYEECKSKQKRSSHLVFFFDEIPELPTIGDRYTQNEDFLNVYKRRVPKLKKDISDRSN